MADLVALGLLESQPALTLLTATSASINLVPTAASGDPDVIVETSTSSDMSGATEHGPAVDGLGIDPNDPYAAPITGLAAGTTYYYRVRLDQGATDVYSDIYSFTTTRTYLQETKWSTISDGHRLSGTARGHTVRIAVHDQAMENVAADEGSLVVSVGDDVPFAHFNADVVDIFPIDVNGAPATPTSKFAISQQDCDYDCRLWRKYDQGALTQKELLKCGGNHDGEHWWELAANNNNQIATATYSRTAFNSYFGNGLAAKALTGGDVNGRWGAYRDGPVLFCFFDVFQNTELSVTNPAAPGFDNEDGPDDENDWTLGQTQWDYFFDATNGWITKATPTYDAGNPGYTGVRWIVCYIHHLVGGMDVDPVTTEHYGTGGKRFVVPKTESEACCEHGGQDAGWSNPYTYASDYLTYGFHKALVNRCEAKGTQAIVFKGHDHHYAREWVDGIPYITCPRMAGANTDPYDVGVKVAAEYDDTDGNTVYKSNSGHLYCTANQAALTVQYKRAYVGGLGVAAPADGVVTNGAIVDTFTLYGTNAFVRRAYDSGNRTVESSIEVLDTNNVQTGYRNAGEPIGLTSYDGTRWKLFTTDADATVGERAYITVRPSEIDGAIVMATSRPHDITSTFARQTALIGLQGPNRRIKVKFRAPATGATAPMLFGIASQQVSFLGTACGKGLYMSYTHGAAGALALSFDNGSADATTGLGGTITSIAYTAPNAAAFDAGLTIELVRDRCRVYSPTNTILLDCYVSKTIQQLISTSTYWHCGIFGRTNNAAGAGHIFEWRDYDAVSLGDAGALPRAAIITRPRKLILT